MKVIVTLDGVERVVDVRDVDGGWSVSLDGAPARVWGGAAGRGTRWRLGPADAPHQARDLDVARRGSAVFVLDGADVHRGEAVDARKAALDLGAGAGAGSVVSPMPGAVVRVLVSPGEAVVKGQILVVVEAMKMENELRASADGVVAQVLVQVGQPVEAGAMLVTLEA